MFKDNPHHGALYGTATECATRAPTPFDTAETTMAEARDLCRRVESLVNRMLGAMPDPLLAAKDNSGPLNGAVLPKLEGVSFETSAAINRAHNALERLEGALP